MEDRLKVAPWADRLVGGEHDLPREQLPTPGPGLRRHLDLDNGRSAPSWQLLVPLFQLRGHENIIPGRIQAEMNYYMEYHQMRSGGGKPDRNLRLAMRAHNAQQKLVFFYGMG